MNVATSKNGFRQGVGITILVSAIFLVGALIGYCRGALGASGSQQQGLDWAWKSGLLFLTMSSLAGVLGGYLLPRWKVHPSIAWGVMMSLAFAFMNGVGSLIEGRGAEAMQEIGEGLLMGAIVGAAVGPILQSRVAKESEKQLDATTLDHSQTD